MCMTLFVHRTICETRRRVIINPLTGCTIYHPFEVPNPCEHQHLRKFEDCPVHGPCCTLKIWKYCHGNPGLDILCYGWQKYHVVDSHMNPATLPPSAVEIQALEIIENPDEQKSYESLRNAFFEAGSCLFDFRYQAEKAQRYVEDYRSIENGTEILSSQFVNIYENFQEAANNLARFKEAWSFHTQLGVMEPCPSINIEEHPWLGVYQICRDENPGIPMLSGGTSFMLERVPSGSFGLADRPDIYPENDAESNALSPTVESTSMAAEQAFQIEINVLREQVASRRNEQRQSQGLNPSTPFPPLDLPGQSALQPLYWTPAMGDEIVPGSALDFDHENALVANLNNLSSFALPNTTSLASDVDSLDNLATPVDNLDIFVDSSAANCFQEDVEMSFANF